MKKKRNFLVQFALQSKYNFFACVVALLVLLFSVSSVTYAWIEGANAFTINSSGSKTVDAAGDYFRAANVTSASSATTTLNLSNYIDPKNLYLAPAKGEVSGNEINVQIKEGETYRDADINDISNNYIFFEVKVHAEDIITDYVFDSSSIKVGTLTAKDINVGVTVLDKDRNALGSKITTAEDVAKDVVATDIDNFTGFQKDTDYILQFKIWTEGTGIYSDSTVNFRLNLVPEKGVSTITFQDVTNSNTSEYLLDGKVLYAVYNGTKTKSSAYVSSTHLYYFYDIPDTQLENVTISAYDTETATTPVASWTPGYTKDKKAYAAYGNIIDSTSSGTFDATHVITLIDSSVENLLQADKNAVKLYNGTNTYTMYNGGGSTQYTVHLPESEFADKDVVFSNTSTYYAKTSNLTTSARYYHILGETQETGSDVSGQKLCAGKLYTYLSPSFDTITLKDNTTGKAVMNNAQNVYVSYSGITTPYKASYTSAENGTWQLTALPTDDSTTGWTISAYENASDSAVTYYWDGDTRELDDNTTSETYTFLNAKTSGTTPTDGTWKPQITSNIPDGILQETKVSFYAGIQTSWNQKTMVLSDPDNTNTKYSAALSNTSIPIKDTSAAERNYYYSPFTLESKKYYMWFNSDNLGLQMSEKAQGGKFYGLWSVAENDNYTCVASATTAATKIAGVSSASSSSPASIALASGNVDFTTNLSSITSIAKTDLWLEYFAVNGTTIDTENYEFLGKVVHADLTANTDITDQFDLSTYTAKAGNVFQVVTVLTDGNVYYVADRDYLKVIDTSAYKSVTVSTVANATVTATYTDENGVSKTIAEGSSAKVAPDTQVTVTVKPDSGYELDAFSITGATPTTSGNKATFTMVDSNDVTVSATITKSADRVIYLYDAKGTFTTTPSIWYWTAGGTSYAEEDGYSYNDNKATMSLVSGYSNVYQFTLKGDSINAQNFIFYSNATVETSNSDTSTKNMYNTSTGNWETFPPTVTTIASGYYLMGTLPGTSWENGVEMYYPSSSSKNAEATVNVTSTGTYEFKFKNGSTWYGCNTTITNTCTNYTFYSNENSNCKFTATSTGTYKFSFNTDTKNLTVTKVS